MVLKEFMDIINNPNYHVETWMGTVLGPGNIAQFINLTSDEVDCEIDDENIIVY